ncbi:hypothetical protein J7M22_18025 [Candidatus Poribacteria bacterium]|nr:hypothetical protein [Candidatus Poribacteria bacterium]
MQYDIAAKVTLERGKEVILTRFLGVEAEQIELIEELPEETVSLRRSDFPMRVTLKDGEEIIVLLEFQTAFSREFIWRLIEYTMRFRLRYKIKVIPAVIILTPSKLATGSYEDEIVSFRYKAIRIWEENAVDYLNEEAVYPFIPLMRGGEKLVDEVEEKIYESEELTTEEKGDILTAMAIFAGLKDKGMTRSLIERRRDIMIQSVAYEMIKEEGLREGIKEGLQQGLQRGFRDSILQVLEEKFSIVPSRVIRAIGQVEEPEVLKVMLRAALKSSSLEEFEEKIKAISG